jgi:hypothetical protein
MAGHAPPPGRGVGVVVEGRRRRRTRAHAAGGTVGNGFASVLSVLSLLLVFVATLALLIPPVASAATPPQRQPEGEYDDDAYDDVAYYDDAAGAGAAAPDSWDGHDEEDEYEDPPAGPKDKDDRGSSSRDEDEPGIIDMTVPDNLAEHEGAVLDAEAEADYQRELQESGLDVMADEEALPADKKLTELEDRLYFGNLTSRNVREAFKGLFEFVAAAPTLEEAKEMNRVLAGVAAEVRLNAAKKKLADAQADIMRAFGINGGDGEEAGEEAGEDAITLDDIPGDEGKLNIKFNLKLAQGDGGAVQVESG